MLEVCTIRGKVWSSAPPSIPVSSDFAYSYAFYDEHTGEVWGKRTIVGGRTNWIYSSRDPKQQDMTIPLEHMQDCIPMGLMCAVVAGWKVDSN